MSTNNVPYTINTIPFNPLDQANSRIEREEKIREKREEWQRQSLQKLMARKQECMLKAREEFDALPSGALVEYRTYSYLEEADIKKLRRGDGDSLKYYKV